MSASREKKIRQERGTGYVSPREQKEAEEQKKLRRSNALYSVIAVLFVLLAAFIITWNSGVLHRHTSAITVGGESYTAAELGFFYSEAYQQWRQSYGGYASYFGLDTSKSLKSQIQDEETGATWADYFADQAATNLQWAVSAGKNAEENGFTWNDDCQKAYDETVSQLDEVATANKISRNAYLKYYYGSGVNSEVFDKCVRMQILASEYVKKVNADFTYTDDEIAAEYTTNATDYDFADYQYVKVDGAAASTTDAEGNAVEPTAEETAAAMEAAKTKADGILAAYAAGTALDAQVGEDATDLTYQDVTDSAKSSGVLSDWVFADGRYAGETAVLADESSSCYYAVVFGSRYRHEYNTVNVRQFLIPVDTSSLDSESDTYEADVQKLKDDALKEANDRLAEWKAGDKTEDSFAAIADEYPDGNTAGGLYEKVAKGDMTAEFEDWIFDPARYAGETGIVYTEAYGYHVVYFIGSDKPHWQVQVDAALRDKDYSAWAEEIVKGMDTEFKSGADLIKK